MSRQQKILFSPATSALNGQRRSTLTAYPILHQYLFFRPRIEPENNFVPLYAPGVIVGTHFCTFTHYYNMKLLVDVVNNHNYK